MDEEQGLSSPIAGGIRAVRNTVSSSIFTGRAVPPPAQPDPQTTSLLNQNSLTLTSVSQQLQNISVSLSSLNFSLGNIKDNLAVSDSLARQREAAKQNRERILAEQGLREGKESDIEKRIQFALLSPVRRIASKTQGILSRLTNFFFILAGGWLTSTLIDMINANADGNVDLLNKLKGKLTTGLIVIGATLTAVTVGLKKIFGLTSMLASRAFRFGFNNILRRPFSAIIKLLTGQVGKVLAKSGIKGGAALGIGGAIASLPLVGGVYSFFERQFKKLGEAFGMKPSASGTAAGATAGATAGAAKTGLLSKALGPFRKIFGGVKSTFAIGTLFDIFVDGVNPVEAIKNNLGGIIVAAIAAPLVIFAAGKIAAALGVGLIATKIITFILGTIPFGLGKSLASKIKIPGFGKKKEEETETEVSAIESETSTVAFGMNSQSGSDSVDNNMIASNTDQSDSITPINSKKELNVAENISNVEEGQPSVVNIPIVGGDSGGGGGGAAAPSGQVEEPSSKLPFIAFDNNNIHTSFAVSTFGAFA